MGMNGYGNVNGNECEMAIKWIVNENKVWLWMETTYKDWVRVKIKWNGYINIT